MKKILMTSGMYHHNLFELVAFFSLISFFDCLVTVVPEEEISDIKLVMISPLHS